MLRNLFGQHSYIFPGDTGEEFYRLSTFQHFPRESSANPRMLATCGLFYTGYKDCVKCFCCGLCVENWAMGDDVTATRWHRDDCQMMRGDECGNVSIEVARARILQPAPDFARSSNEHIGPYTSLLPLHLRNLDVFQERNRLTTFESWPHVRFVHPGDLARSGFFYLGNLDRVKCFSCGGVIANWNCRSVVNVEHRRLYPHCRMVRGIETRNVPAFEMFEMPELPDLTAFEQENLRKTFPCQAPATPSRKEVGRRLETFDSRWPDLVRANPEKIAKAGFFFLGERDRVKCWYCNGGLQNWEPDDEPWTEHAKWFPTCEFLLQQKGTDFVHGIVAQFPNLRRPNQPPSRVDRINEQKRLLRNFLKSSRLVVKAKRMGFAHKAMEKVAWKRLHQTGNLYSILEELIEDLVPNGEETPSLAIANAGTQSTSRPSTSATITSHNTMTSESLSTTSSISGPVPIARNVQSSSTKPKPVEQRCRKCNGMADAIFFPCGHITPCFQCAQELADCPYPGCKQMVQEIRRYTS